MPVNTQSPMTPEELKELRMEWGPFVGPWVRYEKSPIIRLEGKETYSIQNGAQSVIQWSGKWYMFLMTSQPMVTKLAISEVVPCRRCVSAAINTSFGFADSNAAPPPPWQC